MSASPVSELRASHSPSSFDWSRCDEAGRLASGLVEACLLRNTFARRRAERMGDETGTDFFERVDHVVIGPGQEDALRAARLITAEQAAGFVRDGATGSHRENLLRKGGFKGSNQKSVRVIIVATDPRKVPAGH